jgi:putative spermidine/putrescine transport system substrate-binding protein
MDRKTFNRRETMALLGGAAAMGATGPAFAQAEPPKPAQLVVNHSGGAMGTAMRKAFFNGDRPPRGGPVVMLVEAPDWSQR